MRISANWSSILTYCTEITLLSIFSRIKWHPTSLYSSAPSRCLLIFLLLLLQKNDTPPWYAMHTRETKDSKKCEWQPGYRTTTKEKRILIVKKSPPCWLKSPQPERERDGQQGEMPPHWLKPYTKKQVVWSPIVSQTLHTQSSEPRKYFNRSSHGSHHEERKKEKKGEGRREKKINVGKVTVDQNRALENPCFDTMLR